MVNPKSKINAKENQIVFWLKAKNYPLEAIYATAYVFIDRCYVYLDGDPKKEIAVSLKGKEELNNKQLVSLQGEFLNELLNYLLRVEITRSNQKIREYIVASSLISCLPREIVNPPLSQESEDSIEQKGKDFIDWKEDPLGIAIPWEKKQSTTAKKVSQNKK